MRHTILHNGTRFKLESWGNGLSYELTNLATNESAFVQGDDALRFEEEREAIERHKPDLDDDSACAWLWDQCDYGAAAQPLAPAPVVA